MGHRTGMQTSGDHARNMSDVRQQVSADFSSDLTHPLEIDNSRIGAGADSDHSGLMSVCKSGQLLVINPLVLLVDAIMENLEIFAGEVRFVTVRQVPAVRQIHRKHL